MRILWIALAASLCGFSAEGPRIAAAKRSAAQNSSVESADFVSAPLLGYVERNGSTELRALTGTPVSARMSNALPLPSTARTVFPGPGFDFALAAQSGGGILVVRLPSLAASPVPSAARTYDRIVFSPSGASAIAWSEAAQTADVLTGLPDSPAIAWSIENVSPGAMAVSDDASLMLFTSDGVSVTLAGRDGSRSAVYQGAGIADLALRPNSDSAVVVDAGRGQVTMIESLSRLPSVRVLAAGAVIGTPVRATFSRSGDRLLVIDGADAAAALVDMNSGIAARVSLPEKATTARALAGTAVFLLAAPDQGAPGWLLIAVDGDVQISMAPGIAAPLPVRGVGRGEHR